MRTFIRLPLLAALACTLCFGARASVITLDFESLADLEPVTNQFSGLGVSFSNTIALRAGFSLNELEFPPHSGELVVSDDAGPMSLSFGVPVIHVSGFFTYIAALTLTAFDAADNLLGSVGSAFANNAALSGDPGSAPNEFLQLAFAAGIARLTISGDIAGASFVLDDLSLTTRPAVLSEPPPAALLLMLGLAALVARQRSGA